MVISIDEISKYLKMLEKECYHGTVTLGSYDGKFNSIKLNTSVDIDYLKEQLGKGGKK